MIRYTTIKYGGCCGKPEQEYQVPDNITPHELSLLIPGLSLEDATDLLARRVQPDPSCNSFSSQLISRQVQKECLRPAVGTFVNVVIPAGRFTSSLSQQDADQQAEAEFRRIAQQTANQLGLCETPGCTNCQQFRVTRSLPCGEFRRNTQCIQGQCVDTSQEYFVCTGECEGQNCRQPCTNCSPICPTGTCPAGSNCVNGSCKVNCDGADCSTDCPQGRCQDPCTECRNGRCQPRSCPAGQVCVNGQCVDRPCNPECGERTITPGPNDCIQRSIVQSCQGGNCVDTTEERTTNLQDGRVCGTNRVCQNGQCVNVEIPCVGENGSCASGGVCCDNRVCFNGVCSNNCGPGFIRQGNTCVIDNRPNVILTQTQPPPNTFCYFTGITLGPNYPCSQFELNLTGISWTVQTLVLSNGDRVTFKAGRFGVNPTDNNGLRHGQCTERYCYYHVGGEGVEQQGVMNQFWINRAVTQYVTEQVHPHTFPKGYTLNITNSGFVSPCDGSGKGSINANCNDTVNSQNFFNFTFSKTNANAPNITNIVNSSVTPVSTLRPVESGSSNSLNVSLSLSTQNPFGVSPYAPNPNTWQAFGFTNSWTGFTFEQTSPTPATFNNLEGRIVGTNLEVRGGVFRPGTVSNVRLIGTFQVGTTRTTTLQ